MAFDTSLILNKKLSVETIDNGLVKVPFTERLVSISKPGSTATLGSGHSYNEDGSDTGINVNVPAGKGNGVSIRFPFYGKVFGLRWRRNSSACDFSVLIDGVAYGPITGNHNYFVNEGESVVDTDSLVIIKDDLGKGTHYAEIVVTSGQSTNAIAFLGLLLEKRAGYSEKPRINGISVPVALGTTPTAIPQTTNLDSLSNVKKLLFVNTTASAITVTLESSGTAIWRKSIAPNDTDELDLLGVKMNSIYKLTASATGVNATAIGGV